MNDKQIDTLRDNVMDNLLKHAHDAERFAQWVDAGEPAVRGAARSPWLWRGGIAAAAAIAVGVFALQYRTAPAPTPLATGNTETPRTSPITPVTAPMDAPVVTLAAGEPVDLSRWTYLEPGAEDGIPSLSDDRSVLLAVYRGSTSACECLAWRVTDDPRLAQASTDVLSQAIASPCRDNAQGVTVYAVRGPRHLLPFHEEDARMLADCLATNPEDCFTPEGALEHIAGRDAGSSENSWSDLAASALAMCVPQGLSVTSTTMPFAGR